MTKLKDLCFQHTGQLAAMVMQEHREQLEKWGIQRHHPFAWLAFLTEEVGELAEAMSEKEYRDGNEHRVLCEAVQVATLALKIAEMYLFIDQSREET
jgi:NTP pyrophosphatase (non-canonical NTP hydrolase)